MLHKFKKSEWIRTMAWGLKYFPTLSMILRRSILSLERICWMPKRYCSTISWSNPRSCRWWSSIKSFIFKSRIYMVTKATLFLNKCLNTCVIWALNMKRRKPLGLRSSKRRTMSAIKRTCEGYKMEQLWTWTPV